MQANNHIQAILNTTSRALLYNSDNPELKAIFKDIVERLHYCQEIMNTDDKYKLNEISEALDSIVTYGFCLTFHSLCKNLGELEQMKIDLPVCLALVTSSLILYA